MPNMLSRAVAATGDAVAAIVLLRLQFRYQQALNAGGTATAQSYEHLMDETSFSLKQLKTAIGRLRSRELIGSRQAQFYGKNVNWFWLTKKALEALKGSPEQPLKGSAGQSPEGSLSYVQGETTLSDYHEKVSGQEPASDHPEISVQVSGELLPGEKSPPKALPTHEPDMGHSVNDVQGQVKALHAIHKPSGPVEALALVWRKEAKAHFEHELPSLTKAQLGQLKHVIARCPTGKAEAVVRRCVGDWGGFVAHVRDEMQDNKLGTLSPSVGFLLFHVVHAVEFALPKAPKPVKTVEPVKPIFMNIPKNEPVLEVTPLAELLEPVDTATLWEDD